MSLPRSRQCQLLQTGQKTQSTGLAHSPPVDCLIHRIWSCRSPHQSILHHLGCAGDCCGGTNDRRRKPATLSEIFRAGLDFIIRDLPNHRKFLFLIRQIFKLQKCLISGFRQLKPQFLEASSEALRPECLHNLIICQPINWASMISYVSLFFSTPSW